MRMKALAPWRWTSASRKRRTLWSLPRCWLGCCLTLILVVWASLALCFVDLPLMLGRSKNMESRSAPVVTTQLDRITDPINELVATSLRQLHHGTYLVVSPLNDGSGDTIKFVLKTECRPASRWHGQQGWSEVAVHHFQRLFYGDDEVAYPKAELARGVVVAITPKQLQQVVHRDQCGVLNETKALEAMQKKMGEKKLQYGAERGVAGNNPDATVLLIGVALTLREEYGDEVYPSATLHAPYFTVPPYNPKIKRESVHRHVLYDISDVMVFDYLLLNPDRAFKKNWFLDKATRRHVALMDNGWAFAGDKYVSSVCTVESDLLRCPSPMLTWSSKKGSPWRCPHRNTAKAAAADEVRLPVSARRPGLLKWCRFRPHTLRALDRTRAQWHNDLNENGSLSRQWEDKMKSDILLAFLLEAYGSETSAKGFNQALSRYVHGCPSSLVQKSIGGDANSLEILQALETGLMYRMDRLSAHASNCLKEYGEAYVYAEEVDE